MKPRMKHTPGAQHSYTASLPAVGTYGFGATPTAARESLRSQLFNLGRCQECGRPCIGWQTQQQMCGPKYDSVCVRPGSEHLDNDWRARSVGCHWTHPKYPSAVVSSVIKRGQDGAHLHSPRLS